MCILSTPAHITHDAVGCTRGIELRLIYQALAESRRATPSAQTHAPASARRGTRPRTPARRASPRRGARAAPRGRSRQCSPSSARHRGARAGRRSRPPRLRPLGRHARARGGLSAQAQCARLLFAGGSGYDLHAGRVCLRVFIHKHKTCTQRPRRCLRSTVGSGD